MAESWKPGEYLENTIGPSNYHSRKPCSASFRRQRCRLQTLHKWSMKWQFTALYRCFFCCPKLNPWTPSSPLKDPWRLKTTHAALSPTRDTGGDLTYCATLPGNRLQRTGREQCQKTFCSRVGFPVHGSQSYIPIVPIIPSKPLSLNHYRSYIE